MREDRGIRKRIKDQESKRKTRKKENLWISRERQGCPIEKREGSTSNYGYRRRKRGSTGAKYRREIKEKAKNEKVKKRDC